MTGGNETKLDVEPPPRGAHAMAIARWILVAAMAAIAALSVAHSFGAVSGDPASAASEQYYCPMHPQVVQDHPGECPICSMTLVKKEGSGAQGTKREIPRSERAKAQDTKQEPGHEGHRHNPNDPFYCPMHPEETGLDSSARCPICGMKLDPRAAQDSMPRTVPGLVPIRLGMDRVQLIGVRTAPAALEDLTAELRTVGFVSADEAKIARVHTRFSGWIERLAVSETGQRVARGQVLASIYNLELLPAQQEFLTARRWGSEPASPDGPASKHQLSGSLESDARARLELFGMSPADIDRLAETGQPSRTATVTSPSSGYVISKNAVRGAFVQPGTQLFEIADLSRVWVIAEIYEHEVSRVRVGQAADVRLAAYPDEHFSGKLGLLYPAVDARTRTLRARIELDNARMQLRPGMYADVSIQLAPARGVVIPVEALADTGDFQYVFVAKPEGEFEPRRVRAGHRSGDKIQIAEGLSAGEIVVTTSSFLIDSESRLRATIEAVPEAGAAEKAP